MYVQNNIEKYFTSKVSNYTYIEEDKQVTQIEEITYYEEEEDAFIPEDEDVLEIFKSKSEEMSKKIKEMMEQFRLDRLQSKFKIKSSYHSSVCQRAAQLAIANTSGGVRNVIGRLRADMIITKTSSSEEAKSEASKIEAMIKLAKCKLRRVSKEERIEKEEALKEKRAQEKKVDFSILL